MSILCLLVFSVCVWIVWNMENDKDRNWGQWGIGLDFFRHCNQRKLKSNLSLELWENVIGSSRSKFYKQMEQQMHLEYLGKRKKKGGAEVQKTGATKADHLGKYSHAEDFAFYSNCHGKSLKSLTWGVGGG